jgi:Caspase domain
MNRALIVGINDYGNASLNLTASVNDARVVTNLMKYHGNGDANFEDVVLKENVQTKAELNGLIIELFRHKSDIALFYFSGHGNDDSLGYQLATPDGKPNDMGVPMGQVMNLVAASPAKNKIVILECCHAAGVENHQTANGMSTFLHEGVTVLASSKHTQKAYQIGEHSIFTNLMIQAMEGGAADLNGHITTAGIYAYIDKAMGQCGQRPVFKTNISEFVSLRKVKPQVPENIMQQLPVLFEAADYVHPLDPSCEFTNNPEYKVQLVEPYTKEENRLRFQSLQKLQSVGLVVPVGADYMYFAAMESKACKLTPLGQHYWRLMKSGNS